MAKREAALVLLLLGACDTSFYGRFAAERFGNLTGGAPPQVPYRQALVAACGPGGATAHGERLFQRQPYLATVMPTWAEIRWKTAEPAVQTLSLTEPEGRLMAELTVRAETDLDSYQPVMRRARVTDLAPETIYCYEVRDATGALTGRIGFRTSPEHRALGTTALGPGDAVQFIAMGDLGWRTEDQARVYEQMRQVPADAVVLTGDIAYPDGTTEELDTNFFAVYAEFLGHVPYLVAGGNHDYRTRDGMPLFGAFGLEKRYFSRDVGPIHFVILDSVVTDREQLEWLDEDLARNQLPWVVAALHHPPYSSGRHGNNLRIQGAFETIFRRHQVPLVLAGHDHNYERTVPIEGVTYVVTGGGGRGTRPVGSSWFTAHSAQVAHFVHLTVIGDALALRAVDAMGQVFDTAVITRP